MTDKSERLSRDALIVALQEAGAVFHGKECKCPFHDDKRASAGIHEDSAGVWRFKCHSCDVSGDVFDIRARVRGVPLADVLPKGDGKPPTRAVAQRSPARMYATLAKIAQAVKGRVEAIYEYSPDFAVIRSVLPDGSKTFSQVHREAGTWTWGAPAKPWPLYNRAEVGTTKDSIIPVEGEKCAEKLRGIGLVGVTSCCGAGKARYSDWTCLAGRDVVLWPDNDGPGRAHMAEVAAILLALNPPARVRRLDPSKLALGPKGDVADLLELAKDEPAEVKRSAILELIREAEIVSPTSELARIIEDTIEGRRKAIPLPWPRLSRLARPLLPGTITLECGAPGAGKSFALLETAYNLHRGGVPVAMFTLEESREYTLMRLLAQLAGDARLLDPEYVRDNPEHTRATLAEHQHELDAFAPCIFDAPDSQPTLDNLAAWTRERAGEGCRVIVIDPISVADMGSEPWAASTRFMVSAARAIRGAGASLVLAVHPRKGASVNGLVDLDSVAGGAAFVRLAQTVFWLERHTDDHAATIGGMTGPWEASSNRTIHILKARNGPGQGARVAFDFDGDALRFQELGLVEHERRGHSAPKKGY